MPRGAKSMAAMLRAPDGPPWSGGGGRPVAAALTITPSCPAPVRAGSRPNANPNAEPNADLNADRARASTTRAPGPWAGAGWSDPDSREVDLPDLGTTARLGTGHR